MHTITINGNNHPIASNWNELSRDHLFTIARLSMAGMPITEFKTKVLITLLGFEVRQVKEIVLDGETCFALKHGKTTVYLLSALDIAFMLPKLDWLFKKTKKEDGQEEYLLFSRLTKAVIPSFSLPVSHSPHPPIHYAPADGLSNILFQEYIFTETFFVQYSTTGDVAWLNKMIAVLYRPQAAGYNPDDLNYSGDRRELFNDFLIDKRAERIAKLDPVIKHAIMLWYFGCRNHIQKMFPEVFTVGAASGTRPTESDTFKSFLSLVTVLTNNDVTKNEQVRKTNLYEVMISLQAMQIENKRLKELYKKKS